MRENDANETLKRAKQYLKEQNIDTYRLDAELLLCHLLQCTKMQLLTGDYVLNEAQFNHYQDLLKKRAGRMPIQYMLNHCEFMSLDFFVDENTLIPRPDTETLVELAAQSIQKNGYKRILEIGTGTGCISISLAHLCHDVQIIATDISPKALAIARKNAETNHVSKQVQFVESDLFAHVDIPHEFDMIVSNPPYIETETIETLDEQVRCFEPHLALDGGSDGVEFYRAISGKASSYLSNGGMIVFEIGYNQADAVREILEHNHVSDISVVKDLAGLDRVIYGQYYTTNKEEPYV